MLTNVKARYIVSGKEKIIEGKVKNLKKDFLTIIKGKEEIELEKEDIFEISQLFK